MLKTVSAIATQIISSITGGLVQFTGPAAGTTRVITVPNANATMARTDAAQSFTGDQTLSTGNLVVSNGKGIDFSATPGTGTSELLSDYEEGTWTPTQGGGLTVIGTFSSSGSYTKIGRSVTVIGTVNASTSVAVSGLSEICAGLPFTVSGSGGGVGSIGAFPSAAISTCFAAATSVYSYAGVGPTTTIAFAVTYFV